MRTRTPTSKSAADGPAPFQQATLSDRQCRELEYYQAFSQRKSDLATSFEPVEPSADRPWNSYWFLYALVRDLYRPGARLLDFGCGAGKSAVRFAHVGYEVYGGDLASANVQLAQQRAALYGYDARTRFSVQVAERLEYPNAFFDCVIGIDVLHHVEISAAIREVHRVLKPGGTAVFRDPYRVLWFDFLRNLQPVRSLVPNTKSFDKHLTEDERKLTAQDLRSIRAVFPRLRKHPFANLSRLKRFVRGIRRLPGALERLDRWLFRNVPLLHTQAGCAVLVLEKEGARQLGARDPQRDALSERSRTQDPNAKCAESSAIASARSNASVTAIAIDQGYLKPVRRPGHSASRQPDPPGNLAFRVAYHPLVHRVTFDRLGARLAQQPLDLISA